MASVQYNRFTSYNLTEDEEIEGHKFTITQKQVLHNHLVSWAEQQLAVYPDPDAPDKALKMALELQFLKGAQEAVEHILAKCYAIEESEKAEAIQNINQQQF